LPDAISGQISIWKGAIGTIPDGWTLCDGTQGTPDLRDKFIVAAGDTYAVDATGGAVNHDHSFTGDGHNHTILSAGLEIEPFDTLGYGVTPAAATGTFDNGDIRPPYYSLAYIMYL